ncbi:MAG: hypothetical protein PHQ23_15080 [Candidatus Wallbacteria bacterium]|nr:hypothetical protein [Candidatus Wallbacteria bacterium]
MFNRPYYQRVLLGFLPILVLWLRFLFVFLVSIPVLLISDSLICEQLFGYSMFFSSRSRHQDYSKKCVANMRTLESALEMYLMEHEDSHPQIDQLKPYMQGQSIPGCPVSGDKSSYSVRVDDDGCHIYCSIHNSLTDPVPGNLPAAVRFSRTHPRASYYFDIIIGFLIQVMLLLIWETWFKKRRYSLSTAGECCSMTPSEASDLAFTDSDAVSLEPLKVESSLLSALSGLEDGVHAIAPRRPGSAAEHGKELIIVHGKNVTICSENLQAHLSRNRFGSFISQINWIGPIMHINMDTGTAVIKGRMFPGFLHRLMLYLSGIAILQLQQDPFVLNILLVQMAICSEAAGVISFSIFKSRPRHSDHYFIKMLEQRIAEAVHSGAVRLLNEFS